MTDTYKACGIGGDGVAAHVNSMRKGRIVITCNLGRLTSLKVRIRGASGFASCEKIALITADDANSRRLPGIEQQADALATAFLLTQ